jgi:monovalent cation/proton antiporter MnhG/PhaG subunit
VTAREVIVDVLLAAGVACQLACCLGVLVMRDAIGRLHYAMAASTVGPVLIVTAVIVRESFTQPGVNAIAVGAFIFVLGPVLANATARTIRMRELGQVEALPDEEVDA